MSDNQTNWVAVIVVVLVLIILIIWWNNNKSYSVEGFKNGDKMTKLKDNLQKCVTAPYLNLSCVIDEIRQGIDTSSALNTCTVPASLKPECRRKMESQNFNE